MVRLIMRAYPVVCTAVPVCGIDDVKCSSHSSQFNIQHFTNLYISPTCLITLVFKLSSLHFITSTLSYLFIHKCLAARHTNLASSSSSSLLRHTCLTTPAESHLQLFHLTCQHTHTKWATWIDKWLEK